MHSPIHPSHPLFSSLREKNNIQALAPKQSLGETGVPHSIGLSRIRWLSDQEDAHWRAHFSETAYYAPGRGYDQYRPAYQLGWTNALQHPQQSFDVLEKRLEREWESASQGSLLPWREVHAAVADAWQHARQQMLQVVHAPQPPLPLSQVADILAPLQRACIGLEKDLERMADMPMNDFSQQVLQRHMRLLHAFGQELQSIGARTAVPHLAVQQWSQRLHARWLRWRSELEEWGAAQVLEVCEMRERTLLAMYERILRKPLPPIVAQTLSRQVKQLGNHMQKLNWVRQNWKA